MQASLVLGLLTVLLPAANGQDSCLKCTGTQESCSTSNGMCNVTAGGTCMFTMETVSSGVKDSVTVYADCVQKKATCHKNTTTLTVGTGRQVRVSSMCCEKNMCNGNITMAVPSTSTVKNGLQCTACEALNADECKSSSKILCTGSEDHCIDFAGTAVNNSGTASTNVTNNTLILKGCATQSASQWKVNESFYYSEKTYKLTKADCVAATNKGSTAVIHALAFFFSVGWAAPGGNSCPDLPSLCKILEKTPYIHPLDLGCLWGDEFTAGYQA